MVQGLLVEQQDKGKEWHSPLSKATKEVRGEACACSLCPKELGASRVKFAFSLAMRVEGCGMRVEGCTDLQGGEWPTQG